MSEFIDRVSGLPPGLYPARALPPPWGRRFPTGDRGVAVTALGDDDASPNDRGVMDPTWGTSRRFIVEVSIGPSDGPARGEGCDGNGARPLSIAACAKPRQVSDLRALGMLILGRLVPASKTPRDGVPCTWRLPRGGVGFASRQMLLTSTIPTWSATESKHTTTATLQEFQKPIRHI